MGHLFAVDSTFGSPGSYGVSVLPIASDGSLGSKVFYTTPVTVNSIARVGNFVFAALRDPVAGSQLARFSYDPSSGALTGLTYLPFTTDTGSFPFLTSGGGDILVSAGGQDGVVQAFKVNLTTGVPTLIGSFDSARSFRGLLYQDVPSSTIDRVYLSSPDERIVVSNLDVNASSGALATPAEFGSITDLRDPTSLVIDGNRLFVVNSSGFAMNDERVTSITLAATGLPDASPSTFVSVVSPRAVTIVGKYLLVSQGGAVSAVSAFDTTTAMVAAVDTFATGGNEPKSFAEVAIAGTTDRSRVYLSNSNSLVAMTVDKVTSVAADILQTVTGTPFSLGGSTVGEIRR